MNWLCVGGGGRSLSADPEQTEQTWGGEFLLLASTAELHVCVLVTDHQHGSATPGNKKKMSGQNVCGC